MNRFCWNHAGRENYKMRSPLVAALKLGVLALHFVLAANAANAADDDQTPVMSRPKRRQ